MTDTMCPYSGVRDQAIVSYLYEESADFDLTERAAFITHLPTCERCRTELAAFQSVRALLGGWAPPEPARLRSRARFGVSDPAAEAVDAIDGQPWWREIPTWAQVATALLFLGVSAGIANLDVRYDANGLRVRTGWSAAAVAPVAETSRPAAGSAGNDVPWRADLTALEQRLRSDLRQPTTTGANVTNLSNSDLMRRVHALVDEGERRQQRELALRLAEAIRDVNAQRQADLVRIDRNIGAIQNNTGREMLRQRSEMLNYVTVRTASQRPQ